MSDVIFNPTPESFSFRYTVYSHGWSELLPFELDEDKWELSYVFTGGNRGKPVSAVISEAGRELQVAISETGVDHEKVVRDVKHILRLDDALEDFYGLVQKQKGLEWVTKVNAGRLLRSPTVFEDMVKTLCTTNCSWSLTKKMVGNLVEKLGEPAAGGKHAFPAPEAMANVSSDFYREEIRAGYRSPYFAELAQAVASGNVKPETWLRSDLPTVELKKEIKKIKGFGDYAAENLLKLLGRYDGLALDSWLRSQFYRKHNAQKTCPDWKIEKHYKKYAHWQGLAMWCDMTEEWFDGKM